MNLEEKKELILASLEELEINKENFLEQWEEKYEVVLGRLRDIEKAIAREADEEFERMV